MQARFSWETTQSGTNGDVDQLLMMPPSVREWLPEDHLAFFVLDVVAELDLSAFYAAYRVDGKGGSVYDPAMMLSVLLYAYCTGERSSRRIERRLIEDVAVRVVAVNQQPDHATLARFRRRHQDAIAGLFGRFWACASRPVWSMREWSQSMGRRSPRTPRSSPIATMRPLLPSSTNPEPRTPRLRLVESQNRSWPKPSASMRPKMMNVDMTRAGGCRPSGPVAGIGGPGSVLPSTNSSRRRHGTLRPGWPSVPARRTSWAAN